MSGWLSGKVKEVLSGDTVVIIPATAGSAPPPEKRLSLSSISSPKLGRRVPTSADEPFAFASREFLRRLVVGKTCVFRVDYKIDAANGREFGSVFLGEENVALSSVRNGFAKVREGGSQKSPFYEQLVQAQEEAKSKRLGVHNDDPKAMAASIRDVGEEDSAALLKKVGKGGEVKAVVDGVISGSMIRVTLTASRKSQVVLVTGIQCPSMRGPAPAGAEDGATAPEPFAREARWMCESLCLNRDVVLRLDGLSERQGGLIAQLRFPNGQDWGDLGEALLSAGLAKSASWSLNMLSPEVKFRLTELERAAKAARKGQWLQYVPNPNNVQNQAKFHGTVVEIISGDCLIVREDGGAERRVTLSSIRAPRPPARDRAGEPYGAEAKEFLRGRLIGKPVEVEMEYSKKIPVGVGAKEERTVDFGTVFVGGKSSAKGSNGTTSNGTANGAQNSVSNGPANIAELLLIRGLAATVRHRADDERSAYYEGLLIAEENGRNSKKGIHSGKEAPVTRVNDLSAPGSAPKARQHLPFLQRGGTISAVVEYVMSGSRLKLFVPKQSVAIAFSPSGVQCPRKGEPFSDDALLFTRARFMQRAVEIRVEAVDKLGTFLGTISVVDGQKRMDLATALLQVGLAKIHGMSNAGPELVEAQELARVGKAGVWSNEEPDTPVAEDVKAIPFKRERLHVAITEMVDANSFYVQSCDDARPQWIADQIQEMTPDLEAPGAGASMGLLRVGTQVLAKFAADKTWYRAKITKVDTRDPISPKYDVLFIDFGNRDHGLTSDTLRPLTPALNAVPPQATLAKLAFVHAPTELRDDLNYLVMERIAELTDGGTKALKGYKEAVGSDGALHLTLYVPGSTSGKAGDSINGELAMDGLVKCTTSTNLYQAEGLEILEGLKHLEREARQSHLGIFEYGDVDDDEDF
jgi:staphylococcal nuclease domain-containing protein 1